MLSWRVQFASFAHEKGRYRRCTYEKKEKNTMKEKTGKKMQRYGLSWGASGFMNRNYVPQKYEKLGINVKICGKPEAIMLTISPAWNAS